MMANIGYEQARNLAKEKLVTCPPKDIVNNTGVSWNGKSFEIPWFNKIVPLEEGNIEEEIIWLHYLLTQGPKQLRNRYINYKQVPGAVIYNDNFIKRCIRPMVKRFSEDLELFIEKGKELGGRPVDLGHAAFTVNTLPYIPLTFVIWQGDDEIEANGNILFDETAIEWLCAEDLVVLAGLSVYRMIKKAN